MKEIIAVLDRVTAAAFNPYPTAKRDMQTPERDKLSSVLRPNFWKSLSPFAFNAMLRRTSMSTMGGKVIRTLTTVMPSDTYAAMDGRDLESMLLL